MSTLSPYTYGGSPVYFDRAEVVTTIGDWVIYLALDEREVALLMQYPKGTRWPRRRSFSVKGSRP